LQANVGYLSDTPNISAPKFWKILQAANTCLKESMFELTLLKITFKFTSEVMSEKEWGNLTIQFKIIKKN
jgi:hypothetical protein